jgi:hypothetical protein
MPIFLPAIYETSAYGEDGFIYINQIDAQGNAQSIRLTIDQFNEIFSQSEILDYESLQSNGDSDA